MTERALNLIKVRANVRTIVDSLLVASALRTTSSIFCWRFVIARSAAAAASRYRNAKCRRAPMSWLMTVTEEHVNEQPWHGRINLMTSYNNHTYAAVAPQQSRNVLWTRGKLMLQLFWCLISLSSCFVVIRYGLNILFVSTNIPFGLLRKRSSLHACLNGCYL